MNKQADLRKWFKERWVDVSRKKKGGGHPPCGRDDADKGAYPKCLPAAKASKLTEKQKKSAVRRKRAGGQGESKTPKYVSTMKKQALFEKVAKNVPTNPELWSRAKAQAKSKFDKYPSAYANGWAAKWYKSKGGGWKKEAAWTRKDGSTKLAFTMNPTTAAALAIGAPAYLGHQAGQTAGKYTASKITPRGNKIRNEELARRVSGLVGAAGGLGAAYAIRGRRSDSVRKAVTQSFPKLTPEERDGIVDLALPAAAGIGGGLAAGAATGALIGAPARVKSMFKKQKGKQSDSVRRLAKEAAYSASHSSPPETVRRAIQRRRDTADDFKNPMKVPHMAKTAELLEKVAKKTAAWSGVGGVLKEGRFTNILLANNSYPKNMTPARRKAAADAIRAARSGAKDSKGKTILGKAESVVQQLYAKQGTSPSQPPASSSKHSVTQKFNELNKKREAVMKGRDRRVNDFLAPGRSTTSKLPNYKKSTNKLLGSHKSPRKYLIPAAVATAALPAAALIGLRIHRNRQAKAKQREQEQTKTAELLEKVAKKTAAWSRKEGKNPEGGLNEKGRKSYERQNPGSNLKPPVSREQAKRSPKSAARRKSFCARMSHVKGPMKDEKGRPTRKALALRAWDC